MPYGDYASLPHVTWMLAEILPNTSDEVSNKVLCVVTESLYL